MDGEGERERVRKRERVARGNLEGVPCVANLVRSASSYGETCSELSGSLVIFVLSVRTSLILRLRSRRRRLCFVAAVARLK